MAEPRWRTALLSQRKTDVLVVGMSKWPTGILADPTTVEGRAAWYSFAFFLRLAAGAHLDVDALELLAEFRTRADGGHAIGEAYLCDQLENGAGYCTELAKPQHLQLLLEQSNPVTPASLAASWVSLMASPVEPPPHGIECDTSCNRCLRDFYNLPYHGLLDWRLGLDMARLADSAGATLDLDTPWGQLPNPWSRLVAGPNAPVPAALQRLGYQPPVACGTLRAYEARNGRRVLLERHPLWQDDHPQWVTALVAAQMQFQGKPVTALNPFRALRRPADYVPV